MGRREIVPGTRAVWMRYVRKWGGAHRQAEEVEIYQHHWTWGVWVPGGS